MEMRRARVLVVDDEPDVRGALQQVLLAELENVDVLAERDGPCALAVLAQCPVDVVLTDFRMPRMDGLELLERIRQQWPDTYGILITAYPDMELAVRAINKGRVHYFLLKSSDPDTIVGAVEDALWDSRRQVAQQHLVRTLTNAVRARQGTF